MIRAVKRHCIVERLFAVIHTDRPGETRLRAHIGERKDVRLKLGELQRFGKLVHSHLYDILPFALAVLEHIVVDGVQYDSAFPAKAAIVPQCAEHIIEGIGQVKASPAEPNVAHLLQLIFGIRKFNELDCLVMLKAIAHDIEEIIVMTISIVILHHVPPILEELLE